MICIAVYFYNFFRCENDCLRTFSLSGHIAAEQVKKGLECLLNNIFVKNAFKKY